MTEGYDEKLERLVDANLNRLREGLRVVEDVARYILDDAQTAYSIKNLRHSVSDLQSRDRLRYRDIESDVCRESTESEMRRESPNDLLSANFARTQESARVLEEAFKLFEPSGSALFKSIRYELYAIEKRLFSSIDSSVREPR